MEITVPSGATVVINVASFEAATNLKNAIEREVHSSPLQGFLRMPRASRHRRN